MQRGLCTWHVRLETFFRIVSTLSKNDEARDLFAIGMATMTILHFADTASCGMIGFAHSIRGEVELVKDLVQMNDQGSPIILLRGGWRV